MRHANVAPRLLLPPLTLLGRACVASQDRHDFSQLVTAIRQQYNENAKSIERTWGGGIMGTKSIAATTKLERALEKERARADEAEARVARLERQLGAQTRAVSALEEEVEELRAEKRACLGEAKRAEECRPRRGSSDVIVQR